MPRAVTSEKSAAKNGNDRQQRYIIKRGAQRQHSST
jgi:hypothetical protein